MAEEMDKGDTDQEARQKEHDVAMEHLIKGNEYDFSERFLMAVWKWIHWQLVATGGRAADNPTFQAVAKGFATTQRRYMKGLDGVVERYERIPRALWNDGVSKGSKAVNPGGNP